MHLCIYLCLYVCIYICSGNPAEDFEFETHMGTLKACVEKHGFIKLTLPAVKIYSLAGHKQELTDKFEKVRHPLPTKIISHFTF